MVRTVVFELRSSSHSSLRTFLGRCPKKDSSWCVGAVDDRNYPVRPILPSAWYIACSPSIFKAVDDSVLDLGKGQQSHASSVVHSCLHQTTQRLETQYDGNTRRNLRHIIFHKDEYSEPQLQVGNVSNNRLDDSEESFAEAEAENPSPQTQLDLLTVPTYAASNTSHSQYSHTPTYYITEESSTPHEKSRVEPDDTNSDSMPLARIPTCAIFHKSSEGRGVPHSFVSKYQCVAGRRLSSFTD